MGTKRQFSRELASVRLRKEVVKLKATRNKGRQRAGLGA